MNILTIADQKAPGLWDYFNRERLSGIDLILSAGDLPPQYLSLLTTFTCAPVLYVHGNHDDCYSQTPPEGCEDIDGKIYIHNGVRILGLGGSMRYKPGDNQYTEKQMRLRVAKLLLKIRRYDGFDILLTHSPARGLGDAQDLPHTGFEVLGKLLDTYKPKYHIHGHVHLNYGLGQRVRQYGETTIINAFEQYRFNYETGERIY